MTLLAVLNSCQKDFSGELPVNEGPLPDLASKVSTTASGFVTDENGEAVLGAEVRLGAAVTTTDKYGYFSFVRTQVIKNAAFVTITSNGYFNAIKTWIAEESKPAFFRIKLIPRNQSTSFDASAGGTLSLSGGASVSINPSSVIYASTGNDYSGEVRVYAHWIDPTSNDLYSTMPGDLRGQDGVGYIRQLTTYGMMAVELIGSSGEKLQLKPGTEAELKFPLPSSLLNYAPTQIPLWYFDETNGLWKLEGIANKSGNFYVGKVTHFSYWNCDVPSNFVQFNCTVTGGGGQPVANAFVKISDRNNPLRTGYGYTNAMGYTNGAVPSNADLLIEVFSSSSCSNASYSAPFSTGTTDVSLGTIQISSNSATAIVSGKVLNCLNNPVSNGAAVVKVNNQFFKFPTSDSGTYNFNLLLCGGSSNASLLAENYATSEQSDMQNITLQPGANNLGTIQVCGNSISQFINITINGNTSVFSAPADSLFQQNQTLPGAPIGITSFRLGQNGFVNFNFSSAGITQGSYQTLQSLYTSLVNDSLFIASPIQVNITEYGAVTTGFIAGSFSGNFTGSGIPPANTYTISCNFRVRRKI
jgi:hypothetical protein